MKQHALSALIIIAYLPTTCTPTPEPIERTTAYEKIKNNNPLSESSPRTYAYTSRLPGNSAGDCLKLLGATCFVSLYFLYQAITSPREAWRELQHLIRDGGE